MVNSGTFFFLARPRRFGKSLLVSTLKELFSGSRSLFEGLWIEDKWEWKDLPVIHISMNMVGYRDRGLEAGLHRMLDKQAETHGVQLTEVGLGIRFAELIERVAHTSQRKRVVVLIDEYDKPIVDYLQEPAVAEAHREIFKTFYGGVKECDEWLELFFITGVSRFHKVSVFSDLNNLRDLSRESRFADLTGYSEIEVQEYFRDEISALSKVLGKSIQETSSLIREWYDGYSWDGRSFVYNPHSVLLLMTSQEFSNHWFSTGTPSFLRGAVTSDLLLELDDLEVGEELFEMSSVDLISPISLLFHAGYLTVKEKKGTSYRLGPPNREVSDSLTPHLLGALAPSYEMQARWLGGELRTSLTSRNFDEFFVQLNRLLSSVPYLLFAEGKESLYHIVLHVALRAMNLETRSEVVSHRGRADTIVVTEREVFIFELKKEKAEVALEQIRARGYAEQFVGAGKAVILVGVEIDTETRQFIRWKVEDFS